MMPRLAARYDVQIEVMTRPKAEYQTDAYFALDLPVVPAVMVEDAIVVEGGKVSWEELEACIRRHLENSARKGPDATSAKQKEDMP